MADDILTDALEQFRESDDASAENRSEAQEDVRFARLGEQWPGKIREQRQEEGRPCLTVNKLNALTHHVINEARQNKPGIKVSPVDNGADEATAEVIGGLTRSIERNSMADVAYDKAAEDAITGGFGFIRIGIEYAHSDTFDMECRIERVPNPMAVHWDTNSTAFDSSDWEYAFVSDFLTPKQFSLRYPDADPVSFDEGSSYELAENWYDDDLIRVAEYWKREEKKRKLLMLRAPDGTISTMREDQVTDEMRVLAEVQGIEVIREREATFYDVKQYTLNAREVIAEDDWPGEVIPIVPVWGDEVNVGGRRHFRSLIRDAKDPQMMFNFWRSASTELVALAPRAPFMVEMGSIPPGYEAEWQSANTRSHAFLTYAKGYNRPQRESFAGVPTGVLQESTSAAEDIQAVTNIYPAAIGAQSREESGRAILARERQGDTANFHFTDNLNRAITSVGKILVDIIPSVYSEREAVRILGEDQKEKVVRLTTQDGGGVVNEDGERDLYNLAVGKYDVTVSSGPSYATQRQETRETLIEIMRQVPGSAAVIGDLAIDLLDIQGGEEIAKRLQSLNPALQGQPVPAGAVPIPGQPGAVDPLQGGSAIIPQ